MGRHEVDGAEVDQLVRGLTEQQRIASDSAETVLARRPGSRWTNVRVQMPAARRVRWRTRIASMSGAQLKLLQGFASRFHMPGAVTVVRLWVGLAALYSLSMTFWPYPKTYGWGLEAYLLSLAVLLVSGIWGARLAWDARLGAAHTVALGSVMWALALVATAVPAI